MKTLRLLSALLLLSASVLHAGQGEKVTPYPAPDIEATDQDGKTVKLTDIYKSSPLVVVYFYPKADTPGCTKQSCSLRDSHAELQKAGVTILGVSADDVAAQKSFSTKYTLPFTLLADKEGKVIQAFKVVQKPNGMASRECFLIKDGQVVWHDAQASTEQQGADVLKVIAELK